MQVARILAIPSPVDLKVEEGILAKKTGILANPTTTRMKFSESQCE